MMAKGSNSSENANQNFTRHRRDRTNRTCVPAYTRRPQRGGIQRAHAKKEDFFFSHSEIGGRKARWLKRRVATIIVQSIYY